MSPSIEPFVEAKYKALVDGLEISEIQYSALERTKRIDSEFYRKANLNVVDILKSWNKVSFADAFRVSDGNHMSISEYFSESGVPYYRGQDIYKLFIEFASPLSIPETIYNKPQMHRSHLKKGDVLVSIVGAIVGNSSIVTTDAKATCSCKLAILRSKNNGILPEMLLVYIKTKYGQNQIQKFKRGAAQTGILLEDFDQLYIPIFGKELQSRIAKIIHLIYKIEIDALKQYKDAEALLLNNVGLPSISNQRKAISAKKLSETLKINGRLDAEYYQPKYDIIFKAIESKDTTSIPEEFEILKNMYTTYSEERDLVGVIKTKQIEVPEIDTFGVESTISESSVVENNLNVLKNNDVVFAAMGVGSLGKTGIFQNDEQRSFVTDSTLRIFRKKSGGRVAPEILALFLQSEIGQELIYRYVVGSTGIINIYDSDIARIPIPLLSADQQLQIIAKVQNAFMLRKKSKRLLDYSINAIEMAIEQGEEIALHWLYEKEAQ